MCKHAVGVYNCVCKEKMLFLYYNNVYMYNKIAITCWKEYIYSFHILQYK